MERLSSKSSKEVGLTWFCVLLLFLPAALSKNSDLKRSFTTAINPGCTFMKDCQNSTTVNLIHIRSDSQTDSLHFIWSFLGRPSLLLAHTPLESQLVIDWSKYVNPDYKDDVSIQFNGPSPFYSFGWSLLKVWVYNDANDTVRMDQVNQTEMYYYNTNGFLWERQNNESVVNSSHVDINFLSKLYKYENTNYSLGEGGYFGIRIRMKNTDEYNDLLPYMLYSGNSSQVDITFHNVQLNFTGDEHPYPPKPRIGLTYVFVQGDSDNQNSTMKIEKTITLNDEHSPGVFEVYNVRTPVQHIQEQSFFQWRPICYTSDIRDIPDSIDVISYNLTSPDASDSIEGLNDTIMWAYYGAEMKDYLTQSLNISFGTQKDGSYAKTKRISWSYSTGFGTPPSDRTSLIVMLVVLIGLGVPMLIVAISVLYVITKRIKKPRDDLLLGN